MNEQKFKSEMRRAKTMAALDSNDPYNSDYWAGYQRGLRRVFHGEKFGTTEEHALWLSLADRDDERSKRRGQGYRDGLAYGDASGKLGRPSVGDVCMDKITVPADVVKAFEKRADAEELPYPDAHRKALRLYAYGVDAAIDDEFARTTGRIIK